MLLHRHSVRMATSIVLSAFTMACLPGQMLLAPRLVVGRRNLI